jgi:hypothetical protein
MILELLLLMEESEPDLQYPSKQLYLGGPDRDFGFQIESITNQLLGIVWARVGKA